jgi:hypothetical protein
MDNTRRVLSTRSVCTAVDDDRMDAKTLELFDGFDPIPEDNSEILTTAILASALRFDLDSYRKCVEISKEKQIQSLAKECMKKRMFKEIRDLGSQHVHL